MIFIENRLENKIIDRLSKVSLYSPILISTISKNNTVTEQGVYKALAYLIEREVVTKSKKLLSLNTFWIEQLKTFTNRVSETYNTTDFENFLLLDDGERLTYNFKNTTRLDIHWMHIVITMLKRFSEQPLVVYNPHAWFMIDRPHTESTFFDWINKNNRMIYFLVGGNTNLDKIIKDKIKSKQIRIELERDNSLPKDKYIAIIGDYIIHTIYGKEFGSEMDNFFKSYSELNKDSLASFKSIVQNNTTSKIIIERNKSKAIKLFKQITKNHYVPLEIKNRMLR